MDTLDRYLAGECTPAEAEMVARWIEGDRSRGVLVDALPKSVDQAAPAPTSWDVHRMWETRRARVLSGGTVPSRRRQRALRIGSLQHRTPLALRVAAAILIAAFAGLLWEGRHAVGDRRTGAVEWREYATAKGQRAEFDLADGTHVRLGVDSRLRVQRDYGRRDRDVSLDGEALFDVEHDSDRPFRVHTARLTAQDLGTSFTVRSYADLDEAAVAVVEGVVSVAPAAGPAARSARPSRSTSGEIGGVADKTSQGAGELVLRGGDVGSVDSTGELSAARGVDITPYTAWADGRLVFRNTPLRGVLAELDRWYDLDCRLADDTLGDLRLTASFQDEPASEVIRLVALSLGLRYERQGKVVTFRAGRPR
jgi:transmembrane sensor